MPKRRNFLGALLGGTAATAMTMVSPPPASTQIVVKERLIWPDFLPPLVGRPETDSDETRRLLQSLLDAERELFEIPRAQDVTWNGITFRLNQGPNVIPAPIAYVYKLAEADKAENRAMLLARKYRHTYGGF